MLKKIKQNKNLSDQSLLGFHRKRNLNDPHQKINVKKLTIEKIYEKAQRRENMNNSNPPYIVQKISRPIQNVGSKRTNIQSQEQINPLLNGPYQSLNQEELEKKVNKLVKKDEFSQQDQQDFPPEGGFLGQAVNIIGFIIYSKPLTSQQLLLKEYDQRNIKYCNEDYSYLSNLLLTRFSQQETAQDIATAYPLFKILRGITKKFMLNELEIIFFLHTIEETKWQFSDSIIIDFSQQFNYDFLNIIHEVHKPEEYKRLILHLVAAAYAIKCYLNETQEVLVINAHINGFTRVDLFQKFMDQWRQRYMHGSLRIMPRSINKFFARLVRSQKDPSRTHLEDYNALVDQIISISPPYSSEKQIINKQQKQEFTSILNQPPTNNHQQLQQISQQQSYLQQSTLSLFPQQSQIFNPQQQQQLSIPLQKLNSIFQTGDQFYLPDTQMKSSQMALPHDDEHMQQSMNMSGYQFGLLNHSLSPKNSDNKQFNLKNLSDKVKEEQQKKVKEEQQVHDEPQNQNNPLHLLRGSSTSGYFNNHDPNNFHHTHHLS